MPYLIHRARKLIYDPTCAHPPSEAIKKATREFAERAMKLTEGKGYSNTESTDKKLKEFCDHELVKTDQCEMHNFFVTYCVADKL